MISMSLSLMIISIILYATNHKRNSFKRLKVLIPIILIIFGINYLIFKIIDYDVLFYIIAAACAIDNLIYFYQKKNMEKKNEVK